MHLPTSALALLLACSLAPFALPGDAFAAADGATEATANRVETDGVSHDAGTDVASADETTLAAWRAVARGDAVALMRHALAPGTGDPADFDVDDCTTQRNLSEAGRAQARRIGAHVAAALGTDDVDVRSSAWCRCLETGRLLGFGEVATLPPLNSFFRARESAGAQTDALRRWIDERVAADGLPPAVLVTHQVNITALTGGFAASGEIVIVDAVDAVMARIRIDAD